MTFIAQPCDVIYQYEDEHDGGGHGEPGHPQYHGCHPGNDGFRYQVYEEQDGEI